MSRLSLVLVAAAALALCSIVTPHNAMAQAMVSGDGGGCSGDCTFSSVTSTGKVQSLVTGSNTAIEIAQDARLKMGNAVLYADSNGFVWSPQNFIVNGVIGFRGYGTNGGTGQLGTVAFDDVDGLWFKPYATGPAASSNPTCNSGGEGRFVQQTGAGGTYTRSCMCRCDGTSCKWWNWWFPSDASGTATTCPAGT